MGFISIAIVTKSNDLKDALAAAFEAYGGDESKQHCT